MAMSPADLSYIYSLLQNALQQDEGLRKPAEAALASCESRPGFCSCLLVCGPQFCMALLPSGLANVLVGYSSLQEIIASRELEKQSGARWLASVYFKNSIYRYWRAKRDSP